MKAKEQKIKNLCEEIMLCESRFYNTEKWYFETDCSPLDGEKMTMEQALEAKLSAAKDEIDRMAKLAKDKANLYYINCNAANKIERDNTNKQIKVLGKKGIIAVFNY